MRPETQLYAGFLLVVLVCSLAGWAALRILSDFVEAVL